MPPSRSDAYYSIYVDVIVYFRCGPVAVAMASEILIGSSFSVSDIVETAKLNGYTKQGEIFKGYIYKTYS